MYFLGLGLIFLVLKWQAVGPVADWSWWWVAAPFLAAIAWWHWADWSGHTQKKAMQVHDRRRRQRLAQRLQALGRDRSR